MLRNIKYLMRALFTGCTGKRDYTRFIILTRSRTGSSYLVDLLDSHPDIECKGEEFSKLKSASPSLILSGLFPRRSHLIHGFKIFYYHPLDSDINIWELL